LKVIALKITKWQHQNIKMKKLHFWESSMAIYLHVYRHVTKLCWSAHCLFIHKKSWISTL